MRHIFNLIGLAGIAWLTLSGCSKSSLADLVPLAQDRPTLIYFFSEN